MDEYSVPRWTPEWTEDIGLGCAVGITIDDGCLVVLTRNSSGEWQPTTHIPPMITDRLHEIATVGWASRV